MATFSRRTKAIAAFIIVIAVGYVVAMFWQSRNRVPQDFTAARMQGAIIAPSLVNTSNESTADLAKVNEYDQQGDYNDALALTSNMITKSEDLRNQAVQLSAQVEEMTKALSGIKDVTAQQAALESISSRLALINQLVNYSADLEHLLEVLQLRFSGQTEPRGEVQGLVNQINTDVNAINNFNTQAGQAMESFDKIVGS